MQEHEDLGNYLVEAIEGAKAEAEKAKVRAQALELKDALMVALANNVTFDDALMAHANMTETEALMLLESLDKEGEEILDKFEDLEARLKKEEEIEAARVTSGIEYDDEEDFLGDDNSTDLEGGRRMRYVPDPSERRLADIEFEITERKRRRRLTAIDFEGHAADFERRLADHIEELQGHIRELQESCTNNMGCAAESMEPMIEDIGTKGEIVTSKTRTMTTLLGEMKNAQVSLDNIDTSSELIYAAVTIAAVIPGIGKLVFKALKNVMKPINKGLSKVDDKATKLQNRVGNKWLASVGNVEKVIDSFNGGLVYNTVQAAHLAAALKDSECAAAIVQELSGFDVLGGLETSITAMKTYVESLATALTALSDVLQSQWWTTNSNALSAVVSKVKPIANFFKPFDPLRQAMQYTITIPWFEGPSTTKHLGNSACPSGYKKKGINNMDCFQKPNSEYEEIAIDRFRRKCSYKDLKWNGFTCLLGRYKRKSGGKKYYAFGSKCKTKSYENPWWSTRCWEKCKSGYTDFTSTCVRKSCPSG